jgi:aminomethyltransferase
MWEVFTRGCAEEGGGPFGLMAAFPIAVDKGFLFGSDFYEGGTPLEYGLGWSVAFDKGFFHGRDELLRRKERGLATKLVGIEADDLQHPISGGLKLLADGAAVGATTVGWVSPLLKRNLGRAWIKIEHAKPGTIMEVDSESGPRTVRVAESYRFFDPQSERVKVNPRDLL